MPGDAPSDHALAAPGAGHRAIRGSFIRGGGYGLGLLLTAIASIFLLRHLGVVRFGQFATVIAIVTIVQGATEAGLTVVGQRAFIHADAQERRALLGDLVGMRLVLTPLGVLAGVAFALIAGYPGVLVTGTILAGVGVVLTNLVATLTLPLSVELRLGAVTAIDFMRQLALVVGIVALVAAGASLLPFFAVYVAGGLVALVAALALVGADAWVAPRFSWRTWKPLVREAGPVALSLVVNVTYIRALIILCSLIATAEQTGLFATAFRVEEILLGVPQLMIGAAFPILAHSSGADEGRLANVLQRMGEASLLLALALGLAIAVAAEPIVRLIAGEAFAAAGETLRIQSVAIAGAFMTQLGTFALIAVRRQRELMLVNALALAVVLALGCTLIPLWEANGAALAASLGELLLATAALTMLARARPALRPDLRYVPKLLLAAGAGALCALLPIPALPAAAAAVLVYAAAALALRAVPLELLDALVHRRVLVEPVRPGGGA